MVLTLAVALAAAALVAAGCGGSDKPAYCSNVSDLQQSVSDLKSVQPNSAIVSTLQTDLQKVQSNANAVVSSAKQDFPNQTSALESSVSSLSTSIKQLPPSPTPQQLFALAPQINSVVTAGGEFGLRLAQSQAELVALEKPCAVVGAAFDPISDELVALARDSYRMFGENDPAFLDTWDSELEWHVPDTLPGGGALHGPAEVLAFFETVSDLWENALPEPEEFLAAGEKLVVLGTWRARARSTGVHVELPFAHVQQFRNGKLVYFRNYIDAAKALQSLEGPAPG